MIRLARIEALPLMTAAGAPGPPSGLPVVPVAAVGGEAGGVCLLPEQLLPERKTRPSKTTPRRRAMIWIGMVHLFAESFRRERHETTGNGGVCAGSFHPSVFWRVGPVKRNFVS